MAHLIEKLIDKEKWPQARELILRELKKHPKDHWLLSRLGLTYYEERQYAKALEFSKKALKAAPDCPLVLWDYAGALDMLGREKEAISIWRKILRSTPYEGCWESKSWTKSLMVDCLYRIGQSYKELGQQKKASTHLKKYIKYKRQGIRSIYSILKAQKLLSSHEVWKGMAQVRRLERSADKSTGAFIHVLAWADSRRSFIAKVKLAAKGKSFNLVKIEDIEPFRTNCFKYKPALAKLGKQVSATKSVRFDSTFFCFPERRRG